MRNFISEADYQSLQDRIAKGEVSLCVKRSVTRDFFIRVGNNAIRNTTGQSLLLKKFTIWVGTIAAPLLFLLCSIFVVQHFGWYSLLSVPALGIFWTVIAGFTGDKGSFWMGNMFLMGSLLLAIMLPVDYAGALTLLALSLWIHRLVYFVSHAWLVELIAESFAAFDMLIEHIEIVTEPTDTP